MSDAQATYVATLDSSQLQASAKSSLTSLQRFGMEIQKRTKDLAAIKAAQDKLSKSAGVQEYLKRQKAIERNEAFEQKAAKRAAETAAKREAAEKLATARRIEEQSGIQVDPKAMAELEQAAKALGVTADDAERLGDAVSPASVVIVEDHSLIRDGLRMLLALERNFRLIGEAGSLAEARRVVADQQPDIVMLDVGLPDGDGIALAGELLQQRQHIEMVVNFFDHLPIKGIPGRSGYADRLPRCRQDTTGGR